MRNHSSSQFEGYVIFSREEASRARHDQPASWIEGFETISVDCPNRRCGRAVRVVLVAGAERYLCPHCDTRLALTRLDGGGR